MTTFLIKNYNVCFFLHKRDLDASLTIIVYLGTLWTIYKDNPLYLLFFILINCIVCLYVQSLDRGLAFGICMISNYGVPSDTEKPVNCVDVDSAVCAGCPFSNIQSMTCSSLMM